MSAVLLFATLLISGAAHAAMSPSLGIAETFALLASTYTNTVPGTTTIDGDLGYTTGPAEPPTVNGTTYTAADDEYSDAGTAQGVALSALASQPCTFEFEPGAIDLASNTEFLTAPTYTPGVYCATGAFTVGTGGITLEGEGTYIFRTTGALGSAANSVISLADGASECDVWWTPIGATTLGANSTFMGNVIDAAGITIGANVTWEGRALAFGGTVTTDSDTITSSNCAAPAVPPPTTSLTVTKTVVNDDDGELVASDFPLFVNGVSVTNGVATTTLAPGTYTVSETGDAGYVAGDWGGDCDADGTVTLDLDDPKTCTVTNDDVEPAVIDDDDDDDDGGSRRSSRRTSVEPIEEPVASSTDAVATTSPVVSGGVSTTFGATSTPISYDGSIPKLPNAGFEPPSSMSAAFAFASILSLGVLGSVFAIRSLRRKYAPASIDAI